MPNTALQEKTVKVLATAQVLNGVGVAGTVAAGSLLVASITESETLLLGWHKLHLYSAPQLWLFHLLVSQRAGGEGWRSQLAS